MCGLMEAGVESKPAVSYCCSGTRDCGTLFRISEHVSRVSLTIPVEITGCPQAVWLDMRGDDSRMFTIL
jgi:hypothetical protein